MPNADFTYRGPAVIFDLDDTLAPERSFAISGFFVIENYLRERLGIEFNKGEVAEIMTKSLLERRNHYDSLEEWLNIHGIKPAEVMPEIVKEARLHHPDTRYTLRPDASELLRELQRRGVRMGIITDGRAETQQNKIDALGLRQYVSEELTFISGITGYDKTTPHNFESAVRMLPEASRFVYVGDNPAKDFLYPNLLGWQTYCLLDVTNQNIFPQPDIAWPEGATKTISSLTEILNDL